MLTSKEDDNEENIILQANEDTSFQLNLSIQNKKELEFHLEETTAKSPYYYKRSFTIEDFYSLHNIFRSCLSLEETLTHLLSVIHANKMFISLKNDGEKLEIKINVINFCTPYEIKFDIKRFSKEEKENLLVDLYEKNKKMLIKLKFLKKIINGSNNLKLKNDLNHLFDELRIPGIEKQKKIPVKKFCSNWLSKFTLKNQKNVIRLNIKNLTEITWNNKNVNLVIDPARSNIKYEKIAAPKYSLEKGQDGDFFVVFPKSEEKDYVCVLNLMVEGLIYYEYEIVLNITIT